MFAITSLLDQVSGKAVQSLWERFEGSCGLTGVKFSPLAHFTWQSAETYQIEPVEAALRNIARNIKPFHAKAGGLGIFTGSMPVVYLGLVKDENLLDLHRNLWERLRPYAISTNVYYSPDNWVPHITLALYDVEPDRLGCAVASIAFQQIDIAITVDNFAVLYNTNGNAGLKSRFGFSEEVLSMGGST